MKGQFVGIFGDVGSGKTSLLSALIGDLRYIPKDFAESNIEKKLEEDMKLIDEIDQQSLMIRNFGNNRPIIVNENIAYIQQNPWIQNKTIRENIIFGNDFD